VLDSIQVTIPLWAVVALFIVAGVGVLPYMDKRGCLDFIVMLLFAVIGGMVIEYCAAIIRLF